jgi:hypothetical protein
VRRLPRGALAALALASFAGPRALLWLSEALCVERPCGCQHASGDRWSSPAFFPQIALQALFATTIVLVGRRDAARRPPLSLLVALALSPMGLWLWQSRSEESAAPLLPASLEGSVSAAAHLVVDVLSGFEVATFCAAASMGAIAALAAFVALAPDPARPEPASNSAKLRRETLGAGTAALAASGAARAVVHGRVSWFDVLAASILVSALGLALVVGPRACVARAPFGALCACAVALAMTLFFLEAPRLALVLGNRVAEGALLCCGLGCGAPAFPVQGAFTPAPEVAGPALLIGVDVAASFVVFVPALVAAARPTRIGAGPIVAVLLAAALALPALSLGQRIERRLDALARPYADVDRAIAQAGVDLPVSHVRAFAFARPARWTLSRGGDLAVVAGAAPEDPHGPPVVAADARLSLDGLLRAVRARASPATSEALRIELVVAPPERRGVDRFGRLAGLFRTDLEAYEIELLEAVGEPRATTMGGGAAPSCRGGEVAIVPAPAATVRDLIAALDSTDCASRPPASRPRARVVLSADGSRR